MDKNLPARPNLDHLRQQAKALLSALASGEADAADTLKEHLPKAQGLSPAQVRQAGFRLADAQSAVARKSGFASWPQLARHVEQLRTLEGTWSFASLEIDGSAIPPASLSASRILIDGDCFRCESPEANYEGVFNIDVETDPHRIDIEFVEGPETGNRNYGIFRMDGDRLEICLDLNGKPHPTHFRTATGSGHAYETLIRASSARPTKVNVGKRENAEGASKSHGPSSTGCETSGSDSASDFAYVPSATLDRIQGDWTAVELIRDGAAFPSAMCATGRRSAIKNEVKIFFGGQLIIHALIRTNESTYPIQIDYLHVGGHTKGALQPGIMEWLDGDVRFCMGPPGGPRPGEFTCEAGSGCTLSRWRLNAVEA